MKTCTPRRAPNSRPLYLRQAASPQNPVACAHGRSDLRGAGVEASSKHPHVCYNQRNVVANGMVISAGISERV